MSPERLVALLLGVLAFPMAIPTARKLLGHDAGFLRDLGFLSGPPGTLLAWGLALVVAAAYIGFAVGNVPPVARTWRQMRWLKLLALAAAIAAATVEEALFRRTVMDAVMQRGGGVGLQVLLSAVTFGLAHALFGLIKRNVGAAVRASVITGLLGGALGVVYAVGGRSLAPCIASHFLITLALEPGLLLAAVTGEWRRAAVHEGVEARAPA